MKVWDDKWAINKIGWHKDDVHPMLLNHFDRLVSPNSNIFVPLCGKSVDMKYLAKHENISHVYGLDVVEKALTEFVVENPELKVENHKDSSSLPSSYKRWQGTNITLLCDDFLTLNDSLLGQKVDAVWDRASMVAITPDLRQKYVETIGGIVQPGAKILLVTLERKSGTKEAMANGPPFSLSESEVRNLYNVPWVESIELVETVDEFQANPSSRQRYKGLQELNELCFLIKIKKDISSSNGEL